MADAAFHRPVPRGVNRRGGATWSGLELKLYRRAMGVRQGNLATRIAMHQSALSALFENVHSPVAVRAENVLKFIDGIDKQAAWDAEDAAKAAAALVELQAKLDAAPVTVEP